MEYDLLRDNNITLNGNYLNPYAPRAARPPPNYFIDTGNRREIRYDMYFYSPDEIYRYFTSYLEPFHYISETLKIPYFRHEFNYHLRKYNDDPKYSYKSINKKLREKREKIIQNISIIAQVAEEELRVFPLRWVRMKPVLLTILDSESEYRRYYDTLPYPDENDIINFVHGVPFLSKMPVIKDLKLIQNRVEIKKDLHAKKMKEKLAIKTIKKDTEELVDKYQIDRIKTGIKFKMLDGDISTIELGEEIDIVNITMGNVKAIMMKTLEMPEEINCRVFLHNEQILDNKKLKDIYFENLTETPVFHLVCQPLVVDQPAPASIRSAVAKHARELLRRTMKIAGTKSRSRRRLIKRKQTDKRNTRVKRRRSIKRKQTYKRNKV